MSEVLTTFLLCIGMILKYFLTGADIDLSFLGAIYLPSILLVEKYLPLKWADLAKFIAHVMFISICIHTVCGFVSFLYQQIFFLGFVNTIIGLNVISSVLMSETMKSISASSLGSKVGNVLNKYYVRVQAVASDLSPILKYVGKNYVWVWTVWSFWKLVDVNNCLCTNTRSQVAIKKFWERYSNSKNYIMDHIMKSYFMVPPPSMLQLDGINKNTLLDTYIMNTSDPVIDAIDDLEDEDLGNVPVPEVNMEEMKKEAMLNRKKELRKKLAEKKAARTTGPRMKTQRMNATAMSNMFNMPGMKEVTDMLLQGNNLEALMKQMPEEQMGMGMGMPPPDPSQMKQVLQALVSKPTV